VRDSEEAYQSQLNDQKPGGQRQYQHVPTPTNKSVYSFHQKAQKMNNQNLSSKGSNNNNSSASSQVNLRYKAAGYD